MPARNFSSTAVEMTLPSAVNSSTTSIAISSVSGLPVSFPYSLILDFGQINEEVVSVTARSGTTLTVIRGEDGTQALAHAAGAKVRHGITGRDLGEAQQHLFATNNVHGIAGTLVGTSDSQVLTNKTIDGSKNSLTNIPSSALGTEVVTKAGTQTLTGKTMSGSNNTFSDIPYGSIVGVPASNAQALTADGQATLTNKSIDGRSNSLSYIDWNNLTNVPSSVSNPSTSTPYNSKYWYGQRPFRAFTGVTSTAAQSIFTFDLGYVDAGVVTISAAYTIQINSDCRADFRLVAGGAERRNVPFDGTAFGASANRVQTCTAVAIFWWAGGNLSVSGTVQKIAGAGSYTTASSGSYCEMLWEGQASGAQQVSNTG